MARRPRIKLQLTKTDILLESAGWIAIVFTWVLVAASYYKLPEIIPVHFNVAGEVDGYGRKYMIMILPLVSTVLYIFMTAMNRFPHMFNYGTTKITEDNAQRQYIHATLMMRWIKLAVAVLLAILTFSIVHVAVGDAGGLGIWLIPLIPTAVSVPIVYFVIKSSEIRRGRTSRD